MNLGLFCVLENYFMNKILLNQNINISLYIFYVGIFINIIKYIYKGVDYMTIFTPRCNKKNLLAIAGVVWMMAGFMVAKLGIQVFLNLPNYKIISLTSAVMVFYIFFNFIFKKMVKKHKNRISSKERETLCVFSFFDIKSYIIMAFMMGLGITIRSIPSINSACWGPAYIGIGGALFLGGVLFLVEWKKWNEINDIERMGEE